jgi:hypothetical protein
MVSHKQFEDKEMKTREEQPENTYHVRNSSVELGQQLDRLGTALESQDVAGAVEERTVSPVASPLGRSCRKKP